MDLRVRIVDARQAGESTAAVARRFAVCPAFVRRLLQRHRETGTLAPRTGPRGPTPKLAAEYDRLRRYHADHPDHSPAEATTALRLPTPPCPATRNGPPGPTGSPPPPRGGPRRGSLGDRLTARAARSCTGGRGAGRVGRPPGQRPGAWHPHRVALPTRVRDARGPGWQVVVRTDRGPESPAPFRAVAGLGMHPLVRAEGGGWCPSRGRSHVATRVDRG